MRSLGVSPTSSALCSLLVCFARSSLLHNQRVVLNSSLQPFFFLNIPGWQNDGGGGRVWGGASSKCVPVPSAGSHFQVQRGCPQMSASASRALFLITQCVLGGRFWRGAEVLFGTITPVCICHPLRSHSDSVEEASVVWRPR